MRKNFGWALLASFLGSNPGAAQEEDLFAGFLKRSQLEEYRNYAEYAYYPYRTRSRVDPRYNFFGDFLAEGFHAFRLDDQRPGKSLIAKDGIYRGMFSNLILARTAYGRFNVALSVGDEIRNHITPLTMKRAGFNGLRWDLEFTNNRVTFLTSRGFDSEEYPTFDSFSSPIERDAFRTGMDEAVELNEDNPVYTFGGHWATQVGHVLSLGGTFINQQQINATALREDNFLRGSVPYPEILPPKELLLRVTDDSPLDGGGAAVFAVALEVEARVVGLGDTLLSSDPESPHFSRALVPAVVGGRRKADHWLVLGADDLQFIFSIPEGVTPVRARYRLTVANDYRIAGAQRHVFFVDLKDRVTPFITLIRSGDSIRDFSNQKEIVLDWGLNSGQSLYGVNFAADLVGLKLEGELSMNTLYRKFPVVSGQSLSTPTKAWYLHVLKSFRRWHGLSLGGEFFFMGPRYGGGYDSRRGGLVLYTDRGGLGGISPTTAEYILMDDNDDNDRYADDHQDDFADALGLEAGVYPGLDEDDDNIPDDDRNANGVPDFEEPFLLYFSDPQEFVYGLDMNNNGVIDVRENDDKPDYPYDRDRRGQHYTAALHPVAGLEIGAGNYRMRAITSGARAFSSYFKGSYSYRRDKRLEVQVNHDSKRVKDNIADPVYVFDPARVITPVDPPQPDPLLQRNSWVHTSFASVRFIRYAPLNLESNFKVVHNRARDLKHTDLVEADRRNTFTMVNKADYRWQRGNLTIWPMYKRLWQKVTVKSRDYPLLSQVQSAPILRVDYRITDDLKVQLGQQGIRLGPVDRLLTYRFQDRVQTFRSFSSTDFMFMLTVRGSYLGNVLTANSGIQVQNRKFDELSAGKELQFTRFFVDVVAGFEHY